MKPITMYESRDGSRWVNPKDAEERDWLTLAISTFESLLPKKPVDKGCKFANGQGYLQCNPTMVLECKKLFTDLVNQQAKTRYASYNEINGRLLDDGYPVLYRFWATLECVDDQYRMWGQMYYRLHPEAGEQIEYQEEQL